MKVSSYRELINAVADEKCRIIEIENDIIIEETVEITGRSNLEIVSDNNSKIYGGYVVNTWNIDGDFYVIDSEKEPRMLIVNGAVRKKSSYPEDGYFEIADETSYVWKGSRNGGWDRQPSEYEMTHVTVLPDDLPENIDIDNCEIRVVHMWDESTVAIDKYDSATGVVTLKSQMAHPSGAFGVKKYQLLNTKFGMKSPGNWYYDKKAKKIYYFPFPEEKNNNTEIMIPVCNSVFVIKDCKNIKFENLKIVLSNSESGKISGLRAILPSGAVQVENSEDIKLNMMDISFSGGQGIKCLNSKNIIIENSIIENCASCGIMTFECEGEYISYNSIKNIGLQDFSAIGIHAGGKSLLVYVLDGKIPEKGQTVIEYNTVENVPYCGITCNGVSHIVRNNRLSECMQKLRDGAAIYCSRAIGMTVCDNYVSDVPSGLAYAIYLDEYSENTVVEGNVSAKVQTPFLNHIAKNCTFRNNIAVNDGEIWIRMVNALDFKWQNNIIVAEKDVIFEFDTFSDKSLTPESFIKFDNDTVYSQKGKIICYEYDYGEKTGEFDIKGYKNESPELIPDGERFKIKSHVRCDNRYIADKTELHCVVTRVIPEKADEYKKLHDEIWDQVVKNANLFNVRNYSIFRYEDLYVSFFEYIGDDFEEDMINKNRLPIVRKWQKLCSECFLVTDKEPELIFFNRF